MSQQVLWHYRHPIKSADENNKVFGITGGRVLEGMKVRPSNPDIDLEIEITSGRCIVGGAQIVEDATITESSISGTPVIAPTAGARIDLVVCRYLHSESNTSATYAIVQGEESSSSSEYPVVPSVPSDDAEYTVLGYYYIEPGQTAFGSGSGVFTNYPVGDGMARNDHGGRMIGVDEFFNSSARNLVLNGGFKSVSLHNKNEYWLPDRTLGSSTHSGTADGPCIIPDFWKLTDVGATATFDPCDAYTYAAESSLYNGIFPAYLRSFTPVPNNLEVSDNDAITYNRFVRLNNLPGGFWFSTIVPWDYFLRPNMLMKQQGGKITFGAWVRSSDSTWGIKVRFEGVDTVDLYKTWTTDTFSPKSVVADSDFWDSDAFDDSPDTVLEDIVPIPDTDSEWRKVYATIDIPVGMKRCNFRIGFTAGTGSAVTSLDVDNVFAYVGDFGDSVDYSPTCAVTSDNANGLVGSWKTSEFGTHVCHCFGPIYFTMAPSVIPGKDAPTVLATSDSLVTGNILDPKYRYHIHETAYSWIAGFWKFESRNDWLEKFPINSGVPYGNVSVWLTYHSTGFSLMGYNTTSIRVEGMVYIVAPMTGVPQVDY